MHQKVMGMLADCSSNSSSFYLQNSYVKFPFGSSEKGKSMILVRKVDEFGEESR